LKRRKYLTISILCLMLTVLFTFNIGAVEYTTLGYRGIGGSGTVFLQNHLDSSIYRDYLDDAVSAWNDAVVLGRSFVVNTQAGSIIYNFDFSTSVNPEYHDLHEREVVAVTVYWGQSTANCTCHTTYAFDIICNDALLANQSVKYKKATLVHELGHTLGLKDYDESDYDYVNYSIMCYGTDFNYWWQPFQFDIDNAEDCWAPHYGS